MIAWINFAVLVAATLLTWHFYVRSVGPAALAQRIGDEAYRKCTRFRLLCSVFMAVAIANYVVYLFYPLPIGLPQTFPWDWWISILIAAVIAVPSGWLMMRGARDAGEETMTVKKEHTLYGGIYTKIRHPQAVGELPLWWVIACLLHSPFLVLYSVVWIPIFYHFCRAEDKDLVIRYGKAYEEYRDRTGMFIPRRK